MVSDESMKDEMLERRRAAAWEAARACAELLRPRFGARRVFIFGSLAGQSPWHARSDIDIAVEGLAPERYFDALRECEALLPEGMELDLIPLESAPPTLRARILGEEEMPIEPTEALRREIDLELARLERLVRSLERLMSRWTGEPDEFALRSLGSILHDFYTGVERIFERIAVRIDGDLPADPHGHTDWLWRMMSPWGESRPAVIDPALGSRLSDYLRFRHLFRHTDGFELEWERCRPLAERMPETFRELRTQLMAFLDSLTGRREP